MVILKLLKRYTTDTLSIMIIPHSGESIRQVNFKKLIFYSLITIFTSICLFFGVLIFVLINLNNELDEKIKILSQVETINVRQSQEIHELKNKASVVNEKLSILDELESQVRNLVGLKTTVAATQSTKTISRSSLREDYKINNSFSTESTIMEESTLSALIDFEDDRELENLAAEMDKEMEKLNVLIEEVTDQLKVLDAKPDKSPALGKLSSKFGYRKSPFTGRTQFHKGIDIANSGGTEITAAGTGIVTFSGYSSGYGNTIIISHGYDYRTVYSHNKENLVKVGQRVSKGESIAKMGSTGKSTGPHLHFEIHYKGKQIDPLTILENH